jgi:hypothetical protein
MFIILMGEFYDAFLAGPLFMLFTLHQFSYWSEWGIDKHNKGNNSDFFWPSNTTNI